QLFAALLQFRGRGSPPFCQSSGMALSACALMFALIQSLELSSHLGSYLLFDLPSQRIVTDSGSLRFVRCIDIRLYRQQLAEPLGQRRESRGPDYGFHPTTLLIRASIPPVAQ